MGAYPYLVAGLEELRLDSPRRNFSLHEYFMHGRELLSASDFEQLRRLFFFNDIRNTVYLFFNQKQKKEDYVTPAYYDQNEFLEGKKDHELFFPFLRRFYDSQEGNGRRVAPDLPPADELTLFLYEDLSTLVSGFSERWYQFELELRNFSLAIALKRDGIDPAKRVIPIGVVAEAVGKSQAPDFGLEREFPWTAEILAHTDSALDFEQTIERVRWNWLENENNVEWDGIEAVLAYAVRLQSVERWDVLDEASGRKTFETMLGTIERSIRFSVELAGPGGQT